MLGQRCQRAAHRDGLPAQAILPVRQAAGHGAVGDQAYLVIPEGVEGEPHHGGVDVHVVRDQLHLGTVFQRRDDRAGGAVGDAGHGIVQVGHMGGTGLKRLDGGIVIGAGVGDGDAHFLVALPDEIQIARLLRSHVHQLDETAGALLQAAEHGRVCALHIFGILGAHLFGADIRAFHVDAHQIRAFAVLVGGSSIHDVVQELFGVGHGCRADGQHALAGFKIRQRLDRFLGAVAEVLAHGPVEVDIHQTRQGIGTLGVYDLFAFFRLGKRHDAAIPDDDAAGFKDMAGGVNVRIADDHNRLSASSSATRVQSGCICRMEPGHSGVTGPLTTALTALALARPLATTRTLRACMMVLMPMV